MLAKSCSPPIDSDASEANSAPEAAKKIWEDLLLDGVEGSWVEVIGEETSVGSKKD